MFAYVDGVATGSPLSSVFANIFLTTGLVAWFRYVNDILAISEVKPDLSLLLASLKILHSTLKFTVETEHILFNVNINYKNSQFHTNTNIKPTSLIQVYIYSGLALHLNRTK